MTLTLAPKAGGRSDDFAITTDDQWKLELPSFLDSTGSEMNSTYYKCFCVWYWYKYLSKSGGYFKRGPAFIWFQQIIRVLRLWNNGLYTLFIDRLPHSLLQVMTKKNFHTSTVEARRLFESSFFIRENAVLAVSLKFSHCEIYRKVPVRGHLWLKTIGYCLCHYVSPCSKKNLTKSWWNSLENQPLLKTILKKPPIISDKRGNYKSLKDMLVRAKL